jgi:Mn-dependent DtxR family transcriptional regulator
MRKNGNQSLSSHRNAKKYKYKAFPLTDHGKIAAKMIVRKHRLWEVFS